MPVLRPPFPARVAVLCALIAAGCGGFAPGAPTSAAPDAGVSRDDPGRADRFDGRRAFAELRHQVELGPWPAGSATLRRLARRYVRRLPNGRIEQVAGGLQNVVGHLPGRKPALLLAAHYDTKLLPG